MFNMAVQKVAPRTAKAQIVRPAVDTAEELNDAVSETLLSDKMAELLSGIVRAEVVADVKSMVAGGQ